MPPALRALLTALLVAGCGGPAADTGAEPTVPGIAVPAGAQSAVVVRNVDGDTVVLRGRGRGPLPDRPTKVRILLIDTPEVFGERECFGERASDRAEQLMPPGAAMQVQADRDRTDRFGRALLQVWTADGANVGEVLVREGYASVLVVQPNTRYLPQLERAERAAQQAHRGLWAACR